MEKGSERVRGSVFVCCVYGYLRKRKTWCVRVCVCLCVIYTASLTLNLFIGKLSLVSSPSLNYNTILHLPSPIPLNFYYLFIIIHYKLLFIHFSPFLTHASLSVSSQPVLVFFFHAQHQCSPRPYGTTWTASRVILLNK